MLKENIPVNLPPPAPAQKKENSKYVICCSSLNVQTKINIRDKVLELGGSFRENLTSEVNVLIAGDVTTTKYKVL